MLRKNPLVARLLPRLVYQLVPAVLVTAVGALLLSNLGKVSATPPAVPVETAISTISPAAATCPTFTKQPGTATVTKCINLPRTKNDPESSFLRPYNGRE